LYLQFNFIFFITIISSLALFQGCSGHSLQNLINGESSSKSSSEVSSLSVDDNKPMPPSQNSALNSISPSSTSSNDHKEPGYLQKSTDEWFEKEWEPLTEGNTSSVQEANSTTTDLNNSMNVEQNKTRTSDDINSTGLQYYVDKAGIYLENKEKRDANKTKTPSHTEKINAMPGIGKSDRRR